jgi:predicted dehydrogenase
VTANLRAGLVGLGMMGRNHARVLASLDGVQLVGIADPQPSVDTAPFGAPVVSDVEALISLGLDYCVVAAPTAWHESIGTALAEAGIHALIEKPLAPDSPAAERLSKVFADRGLIGAVGHIERYNPAEWEALQNFRGVTQGDIVRYAIAKPEPLRAEHEAFRDAVLGLGAQIVTFEEGVRTVQTAEALLRSAVCGQRIAVD